MRSYAPGFIFTTALPPAICAAATAAIRHLKTSSFERQRHQDRAGRVKAVLGAAGLPVMPNDTHIVPVFVGNAEKCKEATDLLLSDHGIYIQPINYPTVPKGTERLRITPTPVPRGRRDRHAGRGAGRCVGAAAAAAQGSRARGRVGRGRQQARTCHQSSSVPCPGRFQRPPARGSPLRLASRRADSATKKVTTSQRAS